MATFTNADNNKCYGTLRKYSGDDYRGINTYLLEEYDENFTNKILDFIDKRTYSDDFTMEKFTCKKGDDNCQHIKSLIPKIKTEIETLDFCLQHASLTPGDLPRDLSGNVILWRGMMTDLNLENGNEIVIKNYLSCSKNMLKTLKFTDKKKNCCLIKLVISDGIPYKDMKHISEHPDEEEILLPRNLTLTYIGKETQEYNDVVKQRIYRNFDKSTIEATVFMVTKKDISNDKPTIFLSDSTDHVDLIPRIIESVGGQKMRKQQRRKTTKKNRKLKKKQSIIRKRVRL